MSGVVKSSEDKAVSDKIEAKFRNRKDAGSEFARIFCIKGVIK